MEIILRKEYSKFITYWLISLLFFISIIVIVGGLTRLTDSGLSITTWDVVKGILPPLNNNQWNDVFNLYKEIPQFYLLNQSMTLNEFKFIYNSFVEYDKVLMPRNPKNINGKDKFHEVKPYRCLDTKKWEIKSLVSNNDEDDEHSNLSSFFA